MRNSRKLLIILGVIAALAFSIGGYFYNKWYHKHVRSQPKMFVYDTFSGPVNPVLIVEERKYRQKLIDYYKVIERGENTYFNFPLKTVPPDEPVYVMGFTSDSLLARIVYYYDYRAFRGGSFTDGWVYSKCLHKTPPVEADK